ncbi:MAG TPA: enoyl-CoA hydratase/isomerase family protein, partial [Alphaproteobacteria bacterium]|nr:enoyl-CoA hydratase/isomerase family protein [Alphaproteobacteria bacterium]
MSEQPIRLARDGEIAELVLDRPGKLNAMNRAIWVAIPRLVAEVEGDPALKVLIVRGASAEAFAAG